MNAPALTLIRTRVATLFARALPFFRSLRDKLRAGPLLVIGVGALWLLAQPNPLVAYPQPVKISLLAWLVCKISIAAYLGYWFDRLLHPRSRPGHFGDAARKALEAEAAPGDDALDAKVRFQALNIARMAAEKRRAFIVCATVLAAGFWQ